MARDVNKDRLADLKELLAEELKADNPTLRYIEDLKLSIERLENNIKFGFGGGYQMVNTCL